ncbi:hypothetical protein [Pontibacillus sp. HMF3514]|uniref:hypothetical protein n=1 Tax=Pontibacillus sp. HMF3514 TaxID=2692425 RepID=UPI00131F5ACE|nr:hypothetical protein [Pontibacillus sp. HMF3514]QHE54007.1 hypothetical protein GS400_19125 [Pontibacillus sp. HMF3514]
MHVFAAFESSEYIELAMGEIMENDFPKDKIVFVEMNNEEKDHQIIDTINYSDGVSFSDTTATLATIGMLLGVIYGSILYIGPVFMGLIGLLVGGVLGFFLDKKKLKHRLHKRKKEINIRTLFIIQCQTYEQVKLVQGICRKYFVSYLGLHDPSSKK